MSEQEHVEHEVKDSAQKDMYDPMPYSQAETGYMPLSGAAGQACANCRFFRPGKSYEPCRIVADGPEVIMNTGWCNEWTAKPVSNIPGIEVVDSDGGFVIEVETAMLDDSKGIVATVTKAAKRFIGASEKIQIDPAQAVQGFKVLNDGKWIAWWTNQFKDLEGEIFKGESIANFVKLVNAGTLPMPELWVNHNGLFAHGVADKLFHIDRFALAVGHFDESNPYLPTFKAYYKANPDLEVSHGFFYPRGKKIDGVYHEFYTYEISVITKNRKAANPYLSFNQIAERNKTMSKEELQQDFDELGFSPQEANNIMKQAQTMGKQLETALVDFKSLTEETGEGDKAEDATDATPETKDTDLSARMTAMEKNIEVIAKLVTQSMEATKALTEWQAKMAVPKRASQDASTMINQETHPIEFAMLTKSANEGDVKPGDLAGLFLGMANQNGGES